MCTKELPGWQSTSGGQKGSTDGTSLRGIWTLKRFYSSPHFLSFAVQRVQWVVYKIASWLVESFFKTNRFRVSRADLFSWYWIALCVVNGAGQILWILRMFFFLRNQLIVFEMFVDSMVPLVYCLLFICRLSHFGLMWGTLKSFNWSVLQIYPLKCWMHAEPGLKRCFLNVDSSDAVGCTF